MKLGPLSEVIVYVRDMHTQVQFYRNVLGLDVTYPSGLEDYSSEYWVTFDTGECALALHGGGEGRLGDDAPKFVFGVSDIESVRSCFTDRGVKLGDVRSPAPGVSVCDGEDPEGNRFSIEERE